MKSIKSVFCSTLLLISTSVFAGPMVFTDFSQLDFYGNFDYALNFNGSGTQQVGDALFTNVAANGSGAPAGVSITGFNRNTTWAGGSALGTGSDNDALEQILRSLTWSAGIATGALDLDIIIGNNYRLQLLFSEGCCNNRHYAVAAEGLLNEVVKGTALDSSSVWKNSASQGYAMTLDFLANDSMLNIDFSRLTGGDTNYHISGLTLERVPEPGVLFIFGFGLAILGFVNRKKSATTTASPTI
ncbi:PEP-CTERM sorting domain-containing protein [Rheinheimera salexigens]|nr:PEP-CTERM sorting domain-containing protein [Rheinheimera salexigens]